MSLREYQRKRRFEKTAEPKGNIRTSADHYSFVVQKHAATHLHYDFRLELDGVLKSWAVPKGPSLNPSTKRLAVQVEDHPLDYGGFEGTIPQGEYGGGTVMVWDRGTWEPLEDPHEGLRKGRLKFHLHGENLQGGWMLLRLQGKKAEDGRQWLLIKEKDEYARKPGEAEITDEATESVLTHRDLKAIAASNGHGGHSKSSNDIAKTKSSHALNSRTAKKPRNKKSMPVDEDAVSGARSAKLPTTFQPQLATLIKEAPAGDDWFHEIKFDGYRMLCRIDGTKVQFFSRNQQDWTAKLPRLVTAAKKLGVDKALLDGEVVVLHKDGTTNFQSLQNAFSEGRSDQLLYYVFDLLYLNGKDLTQVTLEDRKRLLEQLLTGAIGQDSLRYSEHVVGEGDKFLKEACRLGLEGIVSKRRDQPYRSGRTLDWLKIKCLKREEFVIGGFTEPSGARSDFGALLVGYHDKQGKLVYAGKVGTGYNQRTLRDLSRRMRPLEQQTSPFRNLTVRTGPAKTAHWIAPELVAKIQFSNWTDDDKLRHPSFQGLREDKPAVEVVRESVLPMKKIPGAKADSRKSAKRTKKKTASNSKTAKAPAAARSKSSKSSHEETQVAGVRLTHPDKILYPEHGITKLQLAHYYEEIADWILPHIINRPAALVRCPAGYQGQCFYQKHIEAESNKELSFVAVTEKDGTRNYAVIENLRGLISLVQLSVLEIHVWGSHADQLERPDRLTFDLDPDSSVTWADVVQSTKQIREFLSDLGLETFVKTTGGKGLHLVVPIQRRHDWEEVRQFCEAVARAIVAADPKRYTANMSKAARPGKIFVDYLRNARGATAVAAYSTRARAAAPVSVPLHWDELLKRTPSDPFTLENVPQRLARLKQDPWIDMPRVKQSITAGMMKKLRV
jgi:bifunctional non-homologous end joining protein LigD